MIWPFNRERHPVKETALSPETQAVLSRTDALASRVEALGVETRAVAREAQYVRSANNFGPALIAAFSTPRRTP
jgi:hypothetical protein